MFKKRAEPVPKLDVVPTQMRVTSILGENTSWKGDLTGKGGIRIEGLFEGNINLEGLIIVDRKGRVESELIKAETVIVGGSVRSDIQANRVEIRSTGRVWGNVTTVLFSTEEGAYLRGEIQMEERILEEDKTDPVESDPVQDGQDKNKPELTPKKTKG